MKILKGILVLPMVIVIAIYAWILFLKNEYFNNNLIEYEMDKFNQGNISGADYIVNYMKPIIERNAIHIYIFSALFWAITIYIIT